MTSRSLGSGWIDVTLPVEAGMVHWPGDPDVNINRFMDMRNGDTCNVTKMDMCVHTGTHMDAPCHFIKDAAGMEAAPIEVLIGDARVIEIADPVSIRREELQHHQIQPGERILIRSQNSQIAAGKPFKMDFVYIAADAARYLVEQQVAFIGVDYMSVGGYYQDMVDTHVVLLSGKVWIVENLNLRNVPPGDYEMICLPMNLTGADGAPARVLLRPKI